MLCETTRPASFRHGEPPAALFFFGKWAGAASLGGPRYVLGSGLMLLSALCWPGFALAQKQLLRNLSPIQILGFVYSILTVLFLPFARPAAFLALDSVHWAAVGFAMTTTLTAYLTFAAAFRHWEASRVAALCCTSPVITILAAALVHHLAPSLIHTERMTLVSWAGGVLIVSGSALSSLMRGRQQAEPGKP